MRSRSKGRVRAAPMPYASAGPGSLAPPNGTQPLHPVIQTSSGGFVAVGISDHRSAAQSHFSRSSIVSLATAQTSADLDDAIMEAMESELFEGGGPELNAATSHRVGGGSSPQGCSTSRSCAVVAPAELAALAAGFARLPDRTGSACNVTAGSGTAVAAALSDGVSANAALAEILRCGSGGAARGTGGPISLADAAAMAAPPPLLVDLRALQMAGGSTDGAVQALPASGGVGAHAALHPATTTASATAGPHPSMFTTSGAFAVYGLANGPVRHDPRVTGIHSATAVMQRESSLQASVQQGQCRGEGGHYSALNGGMALQHRAAAALGVSGESSERALSHQHQHHRICSISSPVTGAHAPPALANAHPALAQAVASTALAASPGAGMQASSGVADGAVGGELNMPLAMPFASAAAASASADTVVGGKEDVQALGWDMSRPIGPCPVPGGPPRGSGSGRGGGSMGPGSASSYHPYTVAGSIAAAAFRSVNAFSGTPSLAAPGPTSTPNSLTAAQCSEFHTLGGPSSGSNVVLTGAWGSASALSGQHLPSGAYGARAGAAISASFSPLHLYGVLPDGPVASGAASNGLERAAISAATAASGRGSFDCGGGSGAVDDSVASAVRALLRLGPALGLPHPQPPPEYAEAISCPPAGAPGSPSRSPAAAAAASSPGNLSGAAPPAAPPPPAPPPVELLEFLEPCGQPAVDRYLQQLVLDPSPERHVFLCKRPLGSAACRAIASCLRVCPGIKSVTLSYCSITCDGLATLCDGLRCCRDLLVLDLSYNAIGDMGAAALAACLPDMPCLASLTLAGNADLADAGVAALAAATRGCAALRRVGLRGTAAGQLGLRDLAAALASNLRRSAAAARRAGVCGAYGGERMVTWDGTLGSGPQPAATGAAAAGNDGVFIAQLCALLRTLVQPALAAEQAVAEAVSELMVEAPAARVAAAAATAVAASGGEEAASPADGGDFDLLSAGSSAAGSRRRGSGAAVETLAGATSAAAATAVNGSHLPYHPGVIIVDPELREQFEVAMPTPRYEALVSALPRVYVGAEERLPLVVEVLCDEMALALRSKGLVIPPWRESAAMISKWQPKQSKLLIPSGSAGTGGMGGGASGPPSARSTGTGTGSGSVTPRVSLAGGMAGGMAGGGALTLPGVAGGGGAGGGSGGAAPMPVHWQHGGGRGGGGGEPSLGPAPSLGSVASAVDSSRGSKAESSAMGQSFGFRRCTSSNGFLLGSVGMSLSLNGPVLESPSASSTARPGSAKSRKSRAAAEAEAAAAAAAEAAAAAVAAAEVEAVGGISLGNGLAPARPQPRGPPEPCLSAASAIAATTKVAAAPLILMAAAGRGGGGR
ncbi:hypothetical protein GPECTOR_12g512 [Gonium pectorale]|uniref:Uncharacterized protein n=1 Tax=Gonium pectorale TaxID=33097 RepID=A0A150GNY6_GONPE|nr:hypothetical protein GPECTOR_12g512 [Gonium pectorale]|eukprot:KXZ51549.1 hypothetical protein GPECTOR_12g512 [Gonium pectorale]